MQRYNKPELWGGIECSLWRLREKYINQLELAGRDEHALQDLKMFAELGVKKLRYPVLVESHNQGNSKAQWDHSRAVLKEMHSLGIAPIVEFLHHGGGPRQWTFLHDNFPHHVRRFASDVFIRFPWLNYFCPVNEPLTTARFSGLYGLWYPHHRSDESFARIFVAQILATILSVKAIREINPEAKFIQMEDLSKTYSTPLLKYQADFENERRWLTFDMITSRVVPGHPLWTYLVSAGVAEKQLHFIAENAIPPDLLGLNYYLTSERFLDERIDHYPGVKAGGNGRHDYADVEAIRVKLQEPSGLDVLANECWERYNIPMAFSEVHLNGSNWEKIRWFMHVWDTSLALIERGIPVDGVCAWAMTGSHGWDELLSQVPGNYEQGVFSVHADGLADTSYSLFIKDLVHRNQRWHPALNEEGWWRSEDRLFTSLTL